MRLVIQNIKEMLELEDEVMVKDTATDTYSYVIKATDETVTLREGLNGDLREIPFDCFCSIYELPNDLDDMKAQYKKCNYNLVPHELLVTLCYVFEDCNYNEHEVCFAVPIDWLVDLMDKEEGRRCWDRARVLNWLDNEYTSDDSYFVWENAIEDDKVALFEINY